MKSSVIRARVDEHLKVQACAVLASCGLEMSDALRLFLVQVVNHGGLPFSVRQGARHASAKTLKRMKRISQARDRALVAQGGAVEEMFLIRPALAENARVVWPDADGVNEPTLAAEHRDRAKSQARTDRTLRATGHKRRSLR